LCSTEMVKGTKMSNVVSVLRKTKGTFFTFATADSKTGTSALDSVAPNAGSITFLCLLWISPIKSANKQHETRKKKMADVKEIGTIDRGQTSANDQLGEGSPLFVLRVLVSRRMIDVLKSLWIRYQEVFLL
jgi:hypothetical protein